MVDMTARDKLISDWRARLAAAEAEPVSSSLRRAWLVRVQMRLYRFLLALYGQGDGRADERPPQKAADVVVFDSAEAESLAGKPAKDLGKIRSVLKTVANSQDHRPAAGSLTSEEVIAGCWFAVAAVSSRLDLIRCIELLRSHKIECRLQFRAGDRIVEVPGPLRTEALQLIDEHRVRLRRRPRIVHQDPQARAVAAPVRFARQPSSPWWAALVFLLACSLLMLVLATAAGNPQPTDEELQARLVASLGTAAVCCVAIFWSWRCSRASPIISRESGNGL